MLGGHLGFLLDVVDQGLEEQAEQARKLFQTQEFESALEIYRTMTARVERVIDEVGASEKTRDRRDKSRLNEVACLVNLQSGEAALEIISAVDDTSLSTILRIRLVELLSHLGNLQRAETVLAAVSDLNSDVEKANHKKVVQLLEIQRGRIPETLIEDAAVVITAAFKLAAMGEYTRAEKCALQTLDLVESSEPLLVLGAVSVLHLVLHQELFEEVPDATALSPEDRIRILNAAMGILKGIDGNGLPERAKNEYFSLKAAFASLSREPSLEEKGASQPVRADELPRANEVARGGDLAAANAILSDSTHSWNGKLMRAGLLNSSGDWNGAAKILEPLVQEWPCRLPLEAAYSILLKKLGRLDEATKHAKIAFEQFPTVGYRLQFAECLFLTGCYDNAWALLRLLKDSQYPGVIRAMALTAEHAAWDESLALWRRFCELRPDDEFGLLGYARGLASRKQLAKAAEEAWKAFELGIDRLTANDLGLVGQLQQDLPNSDSRRVARLRKVRESLRQRFPENAEAELHVLQLGMAIGEPLVEGEPLANYKLLEKSGHGVAVEIGDLFGLFEQQQQRQEWRQRLYQEGGMPLATLVGPVELVEGFFIASKSSGSFRMGKLPQLFVPVGLEGSVDGLRDKSLLISSVELLLLQSLGCLGELVRSLGEGKLILFTKDFARLVNASKSANELSTAGYSDLLGLLTRLPEKEIEACDSNSVVHWLARKGLIDTEFSKSLCPEKATVVNQPLPLEIELALRIDVVLLEQLNGRIVWDSLCKELGSLWVRGSGDLPNVQERLESATVHNEAVDIVRGTYDVVVQGMDQKQVVIRPEPLVPNFEVWFRTDVSGWVEAAIEGFRETLPYMEALRLNPTWTRVTCDFFGVTAFGPPDVVRHVFRNVRQDYPPMAQIMQKANTRSLGIPQLLRLVKPSVSARARGVEKLALLGFVDALAADDLLYLAQRYPDLERGHPKMLLDAMERLATGHLGSRFVQLTLAQIYGEAIFKAGVGVPSEMEASRADAILITLLGRMERLEPGVGSTVLDDCLQVLALKTVSFPRRVSRREGDNHQFDVESPGAYLWQRISEWCGPDGQRQAARQRALVDAWLVLDGVDERGPAELAAACLSLTSLELRTAPGVVLMNWGDVEAQAILSSNWRVRPLAEHGLDVKGSTSFTVSYEALLMYGARELEAGRVRFDARSAQFVWKEQSYDVKVIAPIEALLLRASDACLGQRAQELAPLQGRHDGELGRILVQLRDNPGDVSLRKAYGRRAAGGLWRRVRSQPGFLLKWPDVVVASGENSRWERLEAILSEPPVSLAQERLHLGVDVSGDTSLGMARLLSERAEHGLWKSRLDAATLVTCAVQGPGLSSHLVVAQQVRKFSPVELAEGALSVLRQSDSSPTGRLVPAMMLIRAVAQRTPEVVLDGITLRLREEIPRIYARILSECLGAESGSDFKGETKLSASIAAYENSLLRSCREIVRRTADGERGLRAQSLEDQVWMSHRLFQWVVSQLESSDEVSRRRGIEVLCESAPSARPATKGEFLDPASFSDEGNDYRLLNILHAITASEWLASQLDSKQGTAAAGETRSPFSDELQKQLVTIADRAGSGESSCTLFDWEGPTNAPDLALYALLRLNDKAVTNLSEEALRRRIAELPEVPVKFGQSRISTFHWVLFLTLCDQIEGLPEAVQGDLQVYLSKLDEEDHVGREWLWLGATALFSIGRSAYQQQSERLLLKYHAEQNWTSECEKYIRGLTLSPTLELAVGVNQLLEKLAVSEGRVVNVFVAVVRLSVRSNLAAKAARELLPKLARHSLLQTEPEVGELLSLLGHEHELVEKGQEGE